MTDPFHTAPEAAKENTVHLIPENDIEPHIRRGEACMCGAQRRAVHENEDGTGKIVGFLVNHYSWDCREIFEGADYV